MANELKDYRKEFKLILAGILIGIIPSIFTTFVQGHLQRKQLILDRRITAIKELSQTNNEVPTELVPKAENIKSQIDKMLTGETKKTTENIDKVKTAYYDLCRQQVSFSRKINTHYIIIGALFDKPLGDTSKIDPSCLTSIPNAQSENSSENANLPINESNETIQEVSKGLDELIKKYYEIETSGNEVINNLASQINP